MPSSIRKSRRAATSRRRAQSPHRFRPRLDTLEPRIVLSTILWDGDAGADAAFWDIAANWEGDRLPGPDDDVSISSPSLTVAMRSGDVTIRSLASTADLSLAGGSLTVTAGDSLVSGSFTIGSGTSLKATGANTIFTATGTSSADGSSFYASNGGVVSLPGLQSYSGSDATIRADGAGSRVDLSRVTTLTGGGIWSVNIQAAGGGFVDLSGVTSNPGGSLGVSATGADADGKPSVVDISQLGRMAVLGIGAFQSASSLEARDGGLVLAPKLTEIVGVTLTTNGVGIPTGQLTSATNSRLVVTGGSPDFSKVTIADGASFIALNGGVLSLPGLQSYSGSDATIRADGAGSRVDLSRVTTLTGGGIWSVNIQAAGGGFVDLSGVTSNPGGSLGVSAIGADAVGKPSMIDLSNLVRMQVTHIGAFQSGSSIEARDGGVILNGALKEIVGVTLTARAEGLATAQITMAVDSTISVVAGAPDFSGLVNIEGSSLAASGGGILVLSALRSYVNSGDDRIIADGADSRVILGSPSSQPLWVFAADIRQTNGGRVYVSPDADFGASIGSSAQLLLNAATSSLLAELSSRGSLEVQVNSTFRIGGDLRLDGPGRLYIAPTGTAAIQGNLLGDSSNHEALPMFGNLLFSGSGAADSPQLLEVMSRDVGLGASGFTRNFVVGTLSLGNNTYLRLVDRSDNAQDTISEALYVNSLVVPAGTTLDLNGLKVYARGAVIEGTVVGGTAQLIADSGPIPTNTYTPGSIGLVGELDDWSFFGRAGRISTIVVNPGGSSAPAPLTPQVGYVDVSLLDPSGAILASGTTGGEGAVVTLSGVTLPADGYYRIQVRAATGQATRTGNYVIGVWDSTPDVATLRLNERHLGQIETPFSEDRWTFSAVAGQQVRFDLLNSTSSQIVYSLAGPHDWTGFTGLGADSDLVTLPSSGTYTLAAGGTGGLVGGSYAFRLEEISRVDLALGSTYTGTITGPGFAQLFRIQVPEGSPLMIRLDDASTSNHNEVYARLGSPPTRSAYDNRFGSPVSPDQTVLVPRATPGEWFVLVYGDDVPAASNFTLTAQSSNVVLTSSSPSKSGTTTATSITLQGAGFVAGTTVALVSATNQVFAAGRVDVDSYQQVTATFAAGALPAGTYLVKVTDPGGSSAILASALTIVAGGQPDFQIRLITPSELGWHGTGQIIVEYTNAGDAAMPAPLVDFTADVNGRQAGFFTLDPSIVTQGFWTSAIPEGFSNSIQFLASGASPGVIQPGETASVTIYYAGWQQPWDFGSRFNFSAQATLADNPTPLDWSQFKETLRPSAVSAAAWEPIFQNFVAQAGSTWGQYIQVLSDNAVYLNRLGRDVRDASELLNFELQQAMGLQPIDSLGTTTDAAVTVTGIDITLGRSFRASLTGRNEDGPFGKGWVMTGGWNLRSDVRPDGTIVISGMNGYQRIFQPDSRQGRGYFAQAGDFGTIGSASGRALVLTEADGTRITFNAAGRVQSIGDLNGNIIVASYTGDRLTKLTHSGGQWVQIEYNAGGRISRILDSVGHSTSYSYDAANEHLLSASHSDGRAVLYDYVTGQGAAREHALSMIQGPSGVKQLFTYDAQGRMISAGKPGGVETVTFGYDSFGTISFSTPATSSAPAATFQLSYDHKGLIARERDALGNTTRYDYDLDGNLTRATDPDGRSTVYSYDARGNVVSSTDARGYTTKFQFDNPFNRLTGFVDALGRRTTYTYDDRGNLTSIVDPAGKAQRWAYDSLGNALSHSNRRDQVIAYSYDTAGRVTSKTLPGGAIVAYAYDDRGNLKSTTDSTGTTLYTFDPTTDRLTKIETPDGHSLAFTYCDCGRRLTSTDDSGYVLTYHYDDNGRLQSITDSNGSTQVAYEYDLNGLVWTKTLGNGVTSTYTYDANRQVLSVVSKAADGSVLSQYDYTYDRRGLRTSMTTLEGTWTYEYDDDGQLIEWVAPDGKSERYTYDALGNREMVVVDGDMAYAYITNELNQYAAITGRGTYTYDADGNLIRSDEGGVSTTYIYDAENNLVQIQRGASLQTYSYEALGQMVGATRDGVVSHYLIDPAGFGNIVAEYDGSNQLVATNVYGGGLISRRRGDVTGYYTFDVMGNTSEVVEASGVVMSRYGYTPFGGRTDLVLASQATSNPFQFGGEYGVMAEPSTIYFMRARFYDPAVGRFIEQDPLREEGDGPNFYSFARLNPLLYLDPSGLLSSRRGDGILCKVSIKWAVTATCQLLLGASTVLVLGGPPGWIARIVIGVACYFASDSVMKLTCDPPPPPPPPPPPGPGPGGGPGGTAGPGSAGSVDPNEKTGPAGYGPQQYIQASSTLNYRIDFENDATATAPAQVVDISDFLSPDFDWSTLQLTSVGWGDTIIAIPAGRNFFQTVVDASYMGVAFQVDVQIGLDADTGKLYAQFLSLDAVTELPPLATIGFLPPEDGTGRGQGFFTYTIRHKSSLPTGTTIRNIAVITFDRGESIATNQVDPHDPSKGTDPAKEALVTLDAGNPTSRVESLSAAVKTLEIPVRWSGQDDAGGAGIDSYTIFVSVDGGPFTAWLTDTPLTEAKYPGQDGHRYAFYSVARDNVGHVEAARGTEDAGTTVDFAGFVTTTEVRLSTGSSTYGDPLNLSAVVQTASGTPTGLVQFFIDGAPVGSPVPLVGGTASLSDMQTIGAGIHAVTASYSGDPGFIASDSATPAALTIARANPNVSWPNPADIVAGTPLGATQLSAQAAVAGVFTYLPAAGTVLEAGLGQTLSVFFTPSDSVNYTAVTRTVSINVLASRPVDTTAPTVVEAPRVTTRKGALSEVTLTFSEPMSPVAAGALGSYRLISAGRDRRFGTRDDKILALKSASYDPVVSKVTLKPKSKVAMNQPMRLIIPSSGALADLALNALDGDRDGRPGGDFLANFGARARSLTPRHSVRIAPGHRARELRPLHGVPFLKT